MINTVNKPRTASKNRPQSADMDIANFKQVNYLEVTRNQHDQRIDNFLLARLKGLPKSHVYKMIRSDEVRINNKRCKAHDKLERGDIVRIAPIALATREKPIISPEFAQSLMQRIVYEDDGLMVIDKPSGMAVHGGSGLDFGIIEAMRETTGKKYLELVHRIDKDTSGLLMIAKKRSTLKSLQQHLRDKTIQKSYLCVVKGQPILNETLIDAPLLRFTLASGERRVRVDAKDEQSKPSQTDILVKARFNLVSQVDKATQNSGVSLVEARPATGRTHQIRVHLAHIGYPILGDDKYNPQDDSGVRRLCLHAWRLQIPDYPIIEAPLADDIASLLPAEVSQQLAVEAIEMVKANK
ncbi:RluA family pseudouridine synthase [Psychrobacter sp. I-STPA10]|uniref:RluA family pseudouridine synthase n=1 Tax=Psychrobacter sp. I-STPA10 TaxID=2585769 RepID=UPI001E36B31B|nr:RluA family pseudouridine synthase [Psychrobacter sp. I-STPA10]